MFSLLPTNKLWHTILCLHGDVNQIILDAYPELKYIADTANFPKFSDDEIADIKDKLGSQQKNVEVITKHGYLFQYNPDILEKILNYKGIEVIAPDFVMYYIMHSYIAWNIECTQNKFPKQLNILLDSLNFLIKTAENTCINDQKTIAASAFYDSLTYCTNEFPESDICFCLDPLESYFNDNADLPVNSFDLLIKAASIVIGKDSNCITHDGTKLIGIFGSLLQGRDDIPSGVITSFQLIIRSAFLNFDQNVIKFYREHINQISSSVLVKEISQVPIAISDSLSNFEHITLFPIEYKANPLPPYGGVETSLHEVDHPTFDNKAEVIELPNLGTTMDPETLLPSEFVTKLILMLDIISQKAHFIQTFLTAWTHLFMMSTNEHYYDIITTFLVILSKLAESEYFFDVLVALSQSPIFDERIGFYIDKDNKSYQNVKILRYHIIQLAVNRCKSALPYMLDHIVRYPLAYAEVIAILNEELIWSILEPSVSNTFINHFYYYQSFEIPTKEINTARLSILSILNKSIYQDNWNIMYSPAFVPEFRTLFFEKPIRWYVTQTMSAFVKNNEELSHSIKELLTIIFASKPTESTMDLYIDALELWYGTLHQLSNEFEALLGKAIDLLDSLSETAKSHHFFVLLLNIFREYCGNKISNDDMDWIESGIENIYNEVDGDLMMALLGIMSTREIKTLDDDMKFTNTKLLLTIIHYFSLSPLIKDFIRFLTERCADQFVRKKLIQIDFDVELIDMIGEWANEGGQDDEAVQMALDLYYLINHVFCSTSAIYKLISLFNPIKNVRKPRFFRTIFDSFEQKILDCYQSPGNFFLNTKQNNCKVSGFDDYIRSFTFSIWLRIMTPEASASILRYTDSESRSINVLIDDGEIVINLFNEEKFKTDVILDVGEWFHVSITFELREKAEITLHLDGNNISKGSFNKYKPPEGPIDILIGNPMDSSYMEGTTGFGKFSFFTNLNDEEVMNDFMIGARVFSETNKRLVSCIPVLEENNTIALKYSGFEAFSVSDLKAQVIPSKSFIHTFLYRIGISILFPLFSFINLPFCEAPNKSETFENYLEGSDAINMEYRLTRIVVTLFKIDSIIEREFEQQCGFQVISYHILNGPKPTYDLYMLFAELTKIIQRPKNITALFTNIIYNFEIWIRCSPEDHLKVITHWCEVLYKRYARSKEKKLPLNSLIQSLRVYYFYTPVEFELIAHPFIERNEAFNVEKVRELIMGVIQKQGSRTITALNVLNMIAIAVSTGDERQALDMVVLIGKIIEDTPDPGKKSPLAAAAILELVLGLSTDEHSMAVIRTLFICHRKEMISFMKPYELSCIATFLVPEGFGSKEIYKELFEVGDRVNTLPLLCVCAINIGMVSDLFEKLKPSNQFSNNEMWWIWPTLAMIYADSQETSDKIAEFIFTCDPNNWTPLLNYIEGFSRAVGNNRQCIRSVLKFVFKNNSKLTDGQRKIVEKCIVAGLLTGRGGQPTATITNMIKSTYGYSEHPKAVFAANDISTDLFRRARAKFSANTRSIRLRKGEDLKRLSFGNFVSERKERPVVFAPVWLHGLLRRADSQQKRGTSVEVNEDGEWIDKDLVLSNIRILDTQWQNFVNWIIRKDREVTTVEQFTYNNDSISRIEYVIGNDVAYQVGRFLGRLSNIAEIVTTSASDDYAGLSARQAIKFLDTVQRDNVICKKLWEHLWQALTVECAPWSYAVQADEMHYKRDMVLCNMLVPMKVRRNFHFKTHSQDNRKNDNSAKSSPSKKPASDKPRTKKDKGKSKGEFEDIDIQVITPQRILEGTLTYSNGLITTSRCDNNQKFIKVSSIQCLLLRTYNQKPTAVEIFVSDGNTHFFNFLEFDPMLFIEKVSAKALNAKLIQKSSFINFASELDFTKQWVSNNMSNFEYLMRLNILAGRSFNYLPAYPYMPWILKDYSEPLTENISIFRDLSKPIGVQNPEKAARLEANAKMMSLTGVRPFLFNYGPTHANAVVNWMIRQEPFTTINVNSRKDQQFDVPERLFISIAQFQKLNEFLELIPEFFFEPEFLVNHNNFDLGNFRGTKIDDVELPPWANSAFDFIYKHRKLLETPYIRNNLHHWIDLVFGYKQKGEAAVAAMNTYPLEMYPEAWEESTSPPEIIENMMKNVGQIPQQLFTSPHPAAEPSKSLSLLCEPLTIQLFDRDTIIIASIRCSTNHAVITMITASGNVKVIKTKLEAGASPIIVADNPCDFKLPSKPIWCPHPIGFLVASKDRMKAYIINASKGTSKPSFEMPAKISALVSDPEHVAAADKDGNVTVFRGKMLSEPKMTLRTFRPPLCAVAISGAMQSCVACSRLGWIVNCSLPSRSVEMANALDVTPVNVLITQAWGLCVVEVRDADSKRSFIHVYSVNGEELKKGPLKASISTWCTFTTVDGFDIVIFADTKHNVWAFEAYYPNKLVAVNENPLSSDIISVEFAREQGSAVIVCADGNMHLLPLPHSVKCSIFE